MIHGSVQAWSHLKHKNNIALYFIVRIPTGSNDGLLIGKSSNPGRARRLVSYRCRAEKLQYVRMSSGDLSGRRSGTIRREAWSDFDEAGLAHSSLPELMQDSCRPNKEACV